MSEDGKKDEGGIAGWLNNLLGRGDEPSPAGSSENSEEYRNPSTEPVTDVTNAETESESQPAENSGGIAGFLQNLTGPPLTDSQKEAGMESGQIAKEAAEVKVQPEKETEKIPMEFTVTDNNPPNTDAQTILDQVNKEKDDETIEAAKIDMEQDDGDNPEFGKSAPDPDGTVTVEDANPDPATKPESQETPETPEE